MNSASAFTVVDPGGPKTKKIPTPEEEAAAGAYTLNGGLAFPAAAFRKAVIAASKGRKVGRLGLPTIMLASCFETADLVQVNDPETGEQLVEYEIDVRGAKPPGQGMVRRARPILHSWSCVVDFEYDDELVSPELIREVLDQAGSRVGVGNYRPEKSGRFGRFEVVHDEPIEG
jgi:hypothetical protein